MSVTQQYAPCSSTTMVPEQHLVTVQVFRSQPAGQVVSAVEATDRVAARRRVLRNVILVRSME